MASTPFVTVLVNTDFLGSLGSSCVNKNTSLPTVANSLPRRRFYRSSCFVPPLRGRLRPIVQEPISHPSQSKLSKTGWIEIYSVYQVTSGRFPHADDTQIVYHSQHTLGDAGAVSQEKKRDESFQSFQACKEGLFRPCLKTFVAPFLPARLSLRGWTRRGLKNVCVGRFEVTDRK